MSQFDGETPLFAISSATEPPRDVNAAGDTHVINVLVDTVTALADMLPNIHVAVARISVPVTVTVVPPAAGPSVGFRLSTVAAPARVNVRIQMNA